MNRHAWLALLVVVALVGVAVAQPTAVKFVKEWNGSIEDEALIKEMPASGVINNTKELEKLWTAWKLEGKAPEVDFKKEMVIVQTSRGSKIMLRAMLDDKGDLKVLGLGTRDLRPGFRYHMATISRDGIKTIAGKEIKD